MKHVQDIQLGEIFNKHKIRDRENIQALHEIAYLYEEFRETISWEGNVKFSQYAITTGKALSNICFDLMSLEQSRKLASATADDLKNSFIFFLAHRGGMCNRLRAIAALSVAANKIGCGFGFNWVETDSCKGGVLPYKGFSNRISPIIKIISMNPHRIIIEDNPASAWHFFDKFKNLGLFNSWAEFSKSYVSASSQLLDTLLEKSDCYELMRNFVSLNRLSNYTALHIRRTDFVKHFTEKHPDEVLPSTADYINHIKKDCPEECFFLSTDDAEVKDAFIREFGDRVLFFDFIFSKNELRQTSFEHSLLDLAILSRSRKLVVTPRSSFSDYAASISNAEIVKL